MTKEEYLTRECHKTCGEGICDVNCPRLLDMANAWDAAVEATAKRAWEWIEKASSKMPIKSEELPIIHQSFNGYIGGKK